MPTTSNTDAPVVSHEGDTSTQTATMRDCVLGLLAMAIPPERYTAGMDPEIHYLKPYYDQYHQLTTDEWLEMIHAAMDHAAATEKSLVKLTRHQKLSLWETMALFLCYQVESDPMTGRCIAYLKQQCGNSRPTLILLDVKLSPLQ